MVKCGKSFSCLALIMVAVLIMAPFSWAGDKPVKSGQHPNMRAAEKALSVAEKQLQQAAHDYGGHRTKAMDLIREAQKEIKAGLEWDKEHPSPNDGKPPKP